MKICSKCKAEKPASEFYKCKTKSDGLRSHCKLCLRKYRELTAHKRVDYDRDRRIEKSEYISEQRREYRIKNAGIISAKKRDHYLKNSEKIKDRIRKYSLENPEKVSAKERNRRARVRLAEGRHTAEDILFILQSQRGLCANCKATLIKSGAKKYHVDHIMPLALGGSNWPSNLQCLCPPCNHSKAAKSPEAWAKQQGKLL